MEAEMYKSKSEELMQIKEKFVRKEIPVWDAQKNVERAQQITEELQESLRDTLHTLEKDHKERNDE